MTALSRAFMCAKCRLPKPLAGSRVATVVGQVAGTKLMRAAGKRRVCAECSPAKAAEAKPA